MNLGVLNPFYSYCLLIRAKNVMSKTIHTTLSPSMDVRL